VEGYFCNIKNRRVLFAKTPGQPAGELGSATWRAAIGRADAGGDVVMTQVCGPAWWTRSTGPPWTTPRVTDWF
jgi:hypothetical protein